MIDLTEKKVSAEKHVKVVSGVKNAIEDEAIRLSRAKDEQVTQGDVVALAMKSYAMLAGISPQDQENVQIFIEILKEGSESEKALLLRQVDAWTNRKGKPQALARADGREVSPARVKSRA